MSPEYKLPFGIAIAGPCSTGKSELANALGVELRADAGRGIDPLVIHYGTFFRLFDGYIPPQEHDPSHMEAMASHALSQLHIEVDHTTGEMHLVDKDARFEQNGVNGMGAARLGGTEGVAKLVNTFVFDTLIPRFVTDNTVVIVDGRERFSSHFIDTLLVRTGGDDKVRRAIYRDERHDAREWCDPCIQRVLDKRGVFEAPILAPVMADAQKVIEVERRMSGKEANKQTARRVAGLIYQYQEGDIPNNFGVIHIQDV